MTSSLATRQSNLRTIEEANKMVPLLRSIGQDIVKTWATILTFREILTAAKNIDPDLMNDEMNEDLQEGLAQLNKNVDIVNGYIREIEQLGCSVSQMADGIISIPSLFQARKIFLCYKAGEESVGHWHELTEAYDDRRVIMPGQDFYWTR